MYEPICELRSSSTGLPAAAMASVRFFAMVPSPLNTYGNRC
jgi:hypothetical protein